MTSILEEENDDCMGGLEGLFTCEEYVEKTFKVGSMSQILLASNMSSVWLLLSILYTFCCLFTICMT